jgi:hypothetical protein
VVVDQRVDAAAALLCDHGDAGLDQPATDAEAAQPGANPGVDEPPLSRVVGVLRLADEEGRADDARVRLCNQNPTAVATTLDVPRPDLAITAGVAVAIPSVELGQGGCVAGGGCSAANAGPGNGACKEAVEAYPLRFPEEPDGARSGARGCGG